MVVISKTVLFLAVLQRETSPRDMHVWYRVKPSRVGLLK